MGTVKGIELKTLTGHSNGVWSLAVLPDGYLASGSWDSKIKIWDTVKWNNFNSVKTTNQPKISLFMNREKVLDELDELTGRIYTQSKMSFTRCRKLRKLFSIY